MRGSRSLFSHAAGMGFAEETESVPRWNLTTTALDWDTTPDANGRRKPWYSVAQTCHIVNVSCEHRVYSTGVTLTQTLTLLTPEPRNALV